MSGWGQERGLGRSWGSRRGVCLRGSKRVWEGSGVYLRGSGVVGPGGVWGLSEE